MRNLISHLALFCFAVLSAGAQDNAQKVEPAKSAPWYFAVAGDSRNCGDVVMPAIAAGAARDHAAFYWHLGDLRKISGRDQDFLQLAELQDKSPSVEEYRDQAWKDFTEHQIRPFGSVPFFIGIGNHETIPPKTRSAFVTEFAEWLNTAEIKDQRLKDDPKDDRRI